MNRAAEILLQFQREQQQHDELAHRDILNFDLYKRLKHMVLHFYKYAGKVEQARAEQNDGLLRHTLIDTLIICLASANALNLALAAHVDAEPPEATLQSLAQTLAAHTQPSVDLYSEAMHSLILIGGAMAKAIESSDHMEAGNPRAEMQTLVPKLTFAILTALGRQVGDLDSAIRARLHAVECRLVLA